MTGDYGCDSEGSRDSIMPCIKFKTNDSTGYICYSNVYRYKNFEFEYHNYLPPSQLNKNGNVRKRISKGFWDAIYEFEKLPMNKRRDYLI